MERRAWAAAVAVVLLWLSGCAATGPKGADLVGQLAALAPGYGRIVFYRSDSFVGGGLRPDIRLDGQVVGESRSGGFFYVDASPGRHTASASTEVASTVEVEVITGQTHYVRSAIAMGLLVGRVTLSVEGEVTAKGELPFLTYTGVQPARIGSPGATPADQGANAVRPVMNVAPLKRGDQIIYRVTEKLTGLTREAVYTVDRVDAQSVRFNQGGRVESPDGSLVSLAQPLAGDMDRCSPPGGWARPDVSLGMAWPAEYARPPGAQCAGTFSLRARVVSDELARTPLGEMRLQRIDFEGSAQLGLAATGISYRIEMHAWYSPELKRVVRFESDMQPSSTGGFLVRARELVELIEVRRD